MEQKENVVFGSKSHWFNPFLVLVLLLLIAPWTEAKGHNATDPIPSPEGTLPHDADIAPAGPILETAPVASAETHSNAGIATMQIGRYEPIGEIVMPPNGGTYTTGVEEKDGYAYLLTRDGYLHTYDVSDVLTGTAFITYDSPVLTQTLSNGNGLLRNGDYLYAYGFSGLTVLNIQNPVSPTVITSTNDLAIFNLSLHNNYLIAPGYEGVGAYSVSDPSSPILQSIYPAADKWFFSAAVYSNTLYAAEFEMLPGATYTHTLRVLDFSDPTDISLVRLIDRSSTAFHLRAIGNALVECHTASVWLSNLDTPTDPVF
jgi:hypothetical protein